MHPLRADLTGQKFHRVEVLEVFPKRVSSWLCVCDCGTLFVAGSSNLKRGNTKSCGCWRLEQLSARAVHSHSTIGSSTYAVWVCMRQRCANPSNLSYKNYGGRGIQVCKRWGKFSNFLADLGYRPEGSTLERKNNNKSYSKANCVWADGETQANNKRSNRLLTIGGQTKTLARWARDPNCAVLPGTFKTRVAAGWEPEHAFKFKKVKSRYEHDEMRKFVDRKRGT